MAKTYIHVIQMPLYSENLNHEEVARRRKPKPMLMQDKASPNETKPNQIYTNNVLPNETKPNKVSPNETKPNKASPNETKPNQTYTDKASPNEAKI